MDEPAPPTVIATEWRTDRLLLRPYLPADLEPLHDLFSREDVCRYLWWEPMDLDAARALLERRMSQTRIEAENDGMLLAVVDLESGRMIGELMLRLSSAEHRQGEIGWTIHPDVQGRGLATEAAREVLRIAFDELGLHRVAADTDPRNTASLRVMARLGMRREAEFKDRYFTKGEWVGEVVCALLASEWRAQEA